MPPKLIIEVVGDVSGLEKAFGKARSSVGGLAVSFGGLVKSVLVVDAVQKSIEGLTGAVHAGISEFKETTQIQAQTAAAIKSTGDISGTTAKQIHGLSLELSNLSGQSDESIQAAENVLLSFTNIRDSLGKNNDIFTRATKTVVDFSARTGRDAPAAAVLLGKALQDPAKRVGILARAGVVLSASQTQVLKSTEKTRGILAAQKILLGDLSDRFKGAAAAAGKTLPGALNILKERFRDLAGEGVKKVSAPLTDLVNHLAGFVVKLTDAKGAAAKLSVLKTGLANLGKSIADAVGSIDFRNLFENIKGVGQKLLTALRAEFDRIDFTAIGHEIGQKLRTIDWKREVTTAGRALGQAVISALNALTTAIKSVDWSKVGKAIVDGLALATAATVKFLASVDWSKVSQAVRRFLIAAFKASNELFTAIGVEIARLLLKGIQKGLTSIGNAVEKLALGIVLKIVEPFTHLPGFLGGGPFQAMKKSLEQTLADMAVSGKQGGAAVGDAIVAGFASKAGALAQMEKTLLPDFTQAVQPTASATSPLKPVASDLLGSPGKRKGITADQRNTFFDNLVGRLLDQASDGTIREQIAKLRAVGALITQRISATKDVTRRLTLEQELLDSVTRPIQALRTQGRQDAIQKSLDAFNNLFAKLQLGADRAAVTRSLQDDLRALTTEQAAIKARIKAVGATSDLEEQLLGVQNQRRAILQQITQNAITARNAKQFKAIGLTATGDDLVPGVKSLKAELGNVATALAGSFLDTSKTRSLLAHIRQVLSGGLGAVGRDVRSKVKGILDDIDNQLKNRQGDVTKFRHATEGDILSGLNLTHDQLKKLRGRLSTIGAGNTVPAGSSAAFAGAGAGGGVHFHAPVTITTNARTPAQMKRDLDKLDTRTPRVRRGAQ